MLNLLALHARRSVVPHQWVLEIWHHALQQMDAAVTLLVNECIAAHPPADAAFVSRVRRWRGSRAEGITLLSLRAVSAG